MMGITFCRQLFIAALNDLVHGQLQGTRKARANGSAFIRIGLMNGTLSICIRLINEESKNTRLFNKNIRDSPKLRYERQFPQKGKNGCDEESSSIGRESEKNLYMLRQFRSSINPPECFCTLLNPDINQ